MKIKYLLSSLSVALFIAACSPKATKVKQDVTLTNSTEKALPVDADVKIGTLPNGLTYYIRKNVEPKNRAELYLANKIGSIVENDDQQGLAHFTEHMAFNGTRDFPKNELVSYLQKAGVRFGADLNAYTGFNQTVYQLPLPTDSVAVFEKGFDILANWAGMVTFEDKEIDQERGVIVEEDRQRGKNAQERMSKQLLPVLLANSRYAERIPIGKVDILQNFKYETIRQFYKDWYRPNLQAVIAVGDFDVNKVEELIKANFSELKNPENPRKREKYTIPNNKEPLVKIVTDPEYPYNVALVNYKHQTKTLTTEEGLKSKMMESLINTMLANRLTEIVQKGGAPFIFAQSNYGAFQGGLVDLDAYSSVAISKDAAGLEAALKAVIAENVRMKKFGFTDTELERAKTNMMTGMEKQFKEKDKTKSAAFVQKYVNNFLDGTAIPSIDFTYNFYKENLNGLALADMNGDGKPDVVVSDNATKIAYLENTSVSGAISFATSVTLYSATGIAYPQLELADIDGDNKPDIIAANNTNGIVVFRNRAAEAGKISADQTICSGITPAPLTSLAPATFPTTGTITYKWQSSTSPTSGWGDIASTNTVGYTIPSGLTTTTYYRRAATIATDYYYTNPIKITVTSNPTITNIVSNTVCGVGSVPINAETSAGSTSFVNWYDAATGGSLIGRTTSGDIFNTPSLNSDTVFYAQAEDDLGCISLINREYRQMDISLALH